MSKDRKQQSDQGKATASREAAEEPTRLKEPSAAGDEATRVQAEGVVEQTRLRKGPPGSDQAPVEPTRCLGPAERDHEQTEVLDQVQGSDEDHLASLPEGDGSAASLSVGTMLRQRFRITGMLGEGGMGAVYSAVDLLKEEAQDENVDVAIKVMKADIVDASMSFMGLQREARRAQQLAHPNIVTVYDFDRADGVIYMTMEYLRGEPLDALLKRKRHGLDLDQARDITAQICRGLAYAHQEGIVHADLKPQNVFILDSGRTKILDFGIARAYQAKKLDQVESVFSGYSPAFASPEVIARSAPTPADDVFALACVVYLLFTGRHPFDWKPADKAREQGLKPRREPAFRRAEWSAMAAALSFEREQRPVDARAFHKKFAPSKVRKTALAMSLASMMVAAGVVYFHEPASGPEIPFEQLPQALQQEIQRNLNDAELFIGYGDFDSGFQLYDTVLRAHPGNLDAVAGMRTATEQTLGMIQRSVADGETSTALARQTLTSLLDYETLPAASRRQIEQALARL